MRKLIQLLILSAILALTKSEPFSSNSDLETKTFVAQNSPRFRLPESFIPYHYDIRIRPILLDTPEDLPQWTAPGNVTIYGTCARSSTNITLHSQVNITDGSVVVTNLATSQAVPITGHVHDGEKTFYTIELGQALDVGVQYSIYIEFVAKVYTDAFEGMYRNHYDDPETGETKYSIATQLQAFGARRVFPCFDEPAMKATFGITLGRRFDYSTICNSPLLQTVPNSELIGWLWDEYNATVKMPSYLVAIIIGDFTFDEASPDIYHKPVRTYGPKHLIDRGDGDFASDIAAKILVFFEEFFDVEYSMHKMDSVGIQDFSAGAMENWGLNIYRESRLLYNPLYNHERDRQRVVLLLNHELAHQWAGNLVTCDWWTMAWLNEGFATYLSYLGMEDTNPEFEIMKAFQFDCIQNAMRNDVLDNAHPTVLPEKENPWATMTYNTALVYSKGAALLRMMEGFLTLDTLQKGLQTYMKAYSFQGANQDQLFQILTGQANADGRLPVGATVKDIMDTWTLQKGFPLIKVTLSADSVILTQEEYKPDNETRVYYIPIAVATESNPDLDNTFPKTWLFQQPNGIQFQHNSSEWIVVNSGGMGYYRVEYDDVLTERLQNLLSLNHQMIHFSSRSQLVDDYFTFAFDRGTIADIEIALGFTKYLDKELESSVWNAFFFHMNKPRQLLLGQRGTNATKSYLLSKVSGGLTTLRNSGADLDIGAANLFYGQLIDWSVALKSEEFMAGAYSYYEEWKLNPEVNPIPLLIRQSIHCAAVQGGSQDNFFFLLDSFMNESEISRTQIINGLACRNDYNTLRFVLGPATGEFDRIPKEYAEAVITAACSVYENFYNLIPLLDIYFDRIVEYHGNPSLIAKGIRHLCSTHSTADELGYINGFMSIHGHKFTDPEDIRILEEAIQTLERNIEWMETYGVPMNNWFEENQ